MGERTKKGGWGQKGQEGLLGLWGLWEIIFPLSEFLGLGRGVNNFWFGLRLRI
jgi:hypothetical protein